MTRVLILEDEPGLVLALTQRLSREGFEVETAGDGESGRATEGHFDLIILDLMLPRKSGFAVCRELRQRAVTTSVILLTAGRQLSDKVLGFKQGADDYLRKLFAMAELMARSTALLRRGPPPQPAAATTPIADSYSAGSIRVEFRRTLVTKADRPVGLAAREFKLQRYLIEHLGQTVTRGELPRPLRSS